MRIPAVQDSSFHSVIARFAKERSVVERMEDITMGKAVSRDMASEFFARIIKGINWGQVDPDVFQKEVIELPAETFNRLMTALVNNNCRLQIKGPSVLVIDRTKLFDPEKFIGSGWTLGEEDERSLALTEIDFSNVRFESGLKEGEESTIPGDEKLARLKQDGSIRLDAKVAEALFEEKGQVTLRFLHDTFGISWMELAGTVLLNESGNRYFLCLGRRGGGSWLWHCGWLGGDRGATGVSPLLATHFISLLYFVGEFCFSTCPNHPPSIFPISSRCVER